MNRQLLLSLIVGLAATNAGVEACHAQWSFNFGYSEGYRGHHHHHPHWYGGYGASWYYRPYVDYVYVAPPPTVYVAPAVTPVVPMQQLSAIQTPAPTLVAATTSPPTTTTAASPVVRNNALPAYSGSGVTIRNPQASGGKVAFVVDERTEMDLAPGESAPLKDKASYAVTFDRGGDFGTTHRVLGEGTYEFVATEKGWELRRETIDAAAVPNLPTVRRNELPANISR